MTLNDKQVEDLRICKQLYKINCFEVCGVKDLETNTYIICCYRIPEKSNIDSFMQRLEQLLQHFINKQCIICGDFNINLSKDDSKRHSFLSLLTCYNFRHLIYSDTFRRNNSSSCIDNILTNIDETY